ncbi:putative PEP-binding protein, partial [Paracoccus sp. (in: a-proteobacteria)]|uniref:putative PEP-binding protein n=1 Tax=Paracoccus sp. TaxID=267 RepID=UPI003A896EEF
HIIARCEDARVPLSFCGEDAGRPVEALTLAALGIRRLSMRPASIGPVKHLIRRVSIEELRRVIDEARAAGKPNLRATVTEWLAQQ